MEGKLTLFTKDRCFYCMTLKEKLDEWGFEYVVLNNHPLPVSYTHLTLPTILLV